MRLTISYVTLRRVEKGWSAKGLLRPLWEKLNPPTAESLAGLSGVSVKSLHGYNSGKRNLGMASATKIANALEISIYDLGAPRPAASLFASSLLGQIVEELERHPPEDPTLLRELAGELRTLADRMVAVAEARDAATLP